MRTVRRLASLALATLFVCIAASPAAAGDNGQDAGGVLTGDGAETVLTIEQVLAGASASPNVPAWMLECTWTYSTRIEAALQSFYYDFFGQDSEENRAALEEQIRAAGDDPNEPFWLMYCPNNATTRSINPEIALIGLFADWPAVNGPPGYVLDVIIGQTLANVQITPQIGQGAPYGDTDAPMITQLPTWLWVEPAVFQPITETSPVIFGTYSVTVTGRPTALSFTTSDGETVNCPTGGTPYNFGLSDEAQSTNCSVLFRHSSAVAEHSLSSTIEWTFDWVCDPGCGGGPLGTIPVTVTRDVIVAELQAITTG